jgi:hypothetical protein
MLSIKIGTYIEPVPIFISSTTGFHLMSPVTGAMESINGSPYIIVVLTLLPQPKEFRFAKISKSEQAALAVEKAKNANIAAKCKSGIIYIALTAPWSALVASEA